MNSCTSSQETFSTGSFGVAREFAGIGPHHGLPLALRHLVLTQIKRLREAHRMHRLHIVPDIGLAVIRPHLKCSGLDADKLHPNAVA